LFHLDKSRKFRSYTGAVFLVVKLHMNLVKDVDTTATVEQCEDITSDSRSDNLQILSETALHDQGAASSDQHQDCDIAESDRQTDSW
jgi:hypothetical protein